MRHGKPISFPGKNHSLKEQDMHVRIYSVHIEVLTEDEGWVGWDAPNIALINDDHAAPTAMARGLELCRAGIAESGKEPVELRVLKEPVELRVHEVRFIAEGHT